MLKDEPSIPAEPGRIGRYALLEPLGEGGMARVFIARKDGSNEICVLKRLHGQLESNKLALKRFQREAHIASMLSHRAIARVLDAGIEEQSFCIAMELIAGHTVEAIVEALHKQSRAVPLPIALGIASEALNALAYAHDFAEDGKPLHIVHRDLTPRNIMLGYDGAVKIIDFGIARGDVDELKTAPGVLMGTPYYMSPEQARTLPVDRRSDLYTFSAVFFEMLAGKRVVQSKGRAAILAEVALSPAPALSSINPQAPRGFDAVLARALAKDPAERPPTAAELWTELSRAAGNVRPAGNEELGRFVRELFPEAEQRAAARIARVRTSGSNELAEVMPTRVERPFEAEPPAADETLPPSSSSRPSTVRRGGPGASPVVLASIAGVLVPVAIAAVYFAFGVDARPPERIEGTVIAEPLEPPPAMPAPSVARATPAVRARAEEIRAEPVEVARLESAKPVALDTKPAAQDAKSPAQDTKPAAQDAKSAAQEAKPADKSAEAAKPADKPNPDIKPADKSAEAAKPADKPNPDTKPADKSEPGAPARPARTAELERMLANLRAAPKDTALRTNLLDRIEAEASKLPPPRQRRIQAAIDPARFDEDVSGLERGIAELKKAEAAGELP